MLHYILQGYTDAIYVATNFRAPPARTPPERSARIHDRCVPGTDSNAPAPIETQVATCCEALFGMMSRIIRAATLLCRPAPGRTAQNAPTLRATPQGVPGRSRLPPEQLNSGRVSKL